MGTGDIGLNTLMTPRYLNLFLDVRLATFHLSLINFFKYQPTVIIPIQLNGIVIDRVSSYKLSGVIITNDLSWNEHCDSIHKKANNIYLSIYLSICLSIYLSIYLSVYLSIYLSIYLLSMLRSDWLSYYYAICHSPVVAKSAGF